MSVSRHALSFALAGGILWAATGAQAQTQPTPPEHYTLDPRGVDLVTGRFAYQTSDVVIGQPGQGGIVHGRVWANNGWRDTLSGTIKVDGSVYTVSFGPVSELFIKSGSTFTPVSNRGAKLTQDTLALLTLTTSDGTVAQYSTTYSGSTSPYQANNAALINVKKPNGELLTYNWNGVTYCSRRGPSPDPEVPGPCEQWSNAVRLEGVTNNFGYQINFKYASNTVPEDGRDLRQNWLRRTGASGINLAVDYCPQSGGGCAGTRVWPSVQYVAGEYGGSITSVTDQSGRTTSYNYAGELVGIRYPGSVSDDVSIGYAGGRVSAVTDASGAWTYGYADSGATRTTTSSGPGGQQLVAISNQTIGRATSVADALGRTVSYQYDAQTRLERITQPEGDYAQLAYDARGNVTQTTSVAKAGSGLANIVTSATYPLSCANPVTCNQPTSTTDARGGVTDYAYDASHGGVLSVTSPAPATGAVRPQTRISYAPQTAWYKNSSGTLVAASTSVTLPATASACTTTSSCAGTADEVKSTVTYGASGVANNLLPTVVTNGNGSGTLTATTTTTYTPNGDVATVDGPLPGTGDTTRYVYDDARQRVGVIGPDPDGGGALLNRSVRTTYNPNGTVARTEVGTTVGQSDPAWSAFASLQQQETAYDAYRRPITQRLKSGATTYSVQQVSYDTAGRPSCSVQRMNPAAFDSLPGSACTSSGVAGFGPDRIIQVAYDAASQVIQTTSGLGTTAAVTEKAAYTANGKPLTLTDGQGNVSTYVYDGFDRVSQLRYPNASGGGSSTTDYGEYGYDAASNVTSHRLRGSQVFSIVYDALNRPTLITAPTGQTAVENVTYTYDNLGRTLSASMSSQTTTLTWDALGRKLSETGPLGAMTYQYDAAGRRTRMTWPDAFYVTYGYDQTNAMTSIKQAGVTQIADYAYDNLGRRASITRGNGVITTYGYDAVSRLTSLSHDLAGTAFDQTYAYSYNPAGQVVSQSSSNPAYAFTGLVAGTDSYAINGRNQVSALNGAPLTNGSSGNLRTDGTRSFTFDFANRLINNAAGASLSYDALGRLYELAGSSVSFKATYDGVEISGLATSGISLQNRFIRGPGTDEIVANYAGTPASTVSYYWLQDRLGSNIAMTDPTGAKFAINAYDEYGQPQAGNTARFQYTGQLWMPDFGVYHYKARAYHPGLGRFLQPDPVGYQAGANLFTYVGADPVNFRDPLGLDGEHLPGGESQCYLRGGWVVVTKSSTVDHNECHFPSAFWGYGGAGNGAFTGGGSSSSGPQTNLVQKALCAAATVVPGNRIRLGIDGVVGLGPLFDAGTGLSFEDSGRVVFDIYGGFGAGVALIGGGGLSIDNNTTPNGLSGQPTGLFGQLAVELVAVGIAIHSLNPNDKNFLSTSGSFGIGPKLGAALGFAQNGAYGSTLADLNCGD